MYSSISSITQKKLKNLFLFFLFITIICLSLRESNFDLKALVEGFSSSLALIKEMFPPDFSRWKRILLLSAQTIAIGVWGTVLGMIVSFPLGLLSARNISDSAVLYHLAKTFVNFTRSVPDILYAMLFVTSIGMGPLAGILALTLASSGLLSKFYSEAIESIDTKPVEALEATGGHQLSVIRHAVLPQVFPLFMGYTLYLLDHNIRVAMVLGLVGAGGLGLELFTQMRAFNYQKASAILIIIFLLITAIDRISAWLRRDLISGNFLNNKGYKKGMLLTIMTATVLLAVYFIPVELKEVIYGLGRVWEFLRGLFPPELTNLRIYIKLMLETIGMGISGTFFAILISIPLGILSARNLMGNVFVYNIMKEISNFLRAMPELMFALLFVAAVGLGPLAGVLAIAVHTAGFLGKFYAEAIENVDPGPVEAIEATGAKFVQILRHAIVPQIIPLFNSYNLYILDRNIRASTVMGIVGAGGIGFELLMSMKLFEYQRTSTIILIILVTIMFIDWFSSYSRKKVVD